MWRSLWPPKPEGHVPPGFGRDRFARLLALVTVVCLAATFIVSNGKQLLMPGPLTSAHGAIKNCAACHTASGSGKLSWIRGLVAGNPLADSKACLSCHKMPATAFSPHGATFDVLIRSTKRLSKIAATTPQPLSARVQSVAFPIRNVVAHGLYCATCHQEHQGANFNLSKISNEQCRSCHVVKFDSFDGAHPQFENYPFKRRTPIIYDHAAHFDKHYPEIAKKDASKRIPATCSTCHDSRDDKRIMAVAPFEKTCGGCHLDQITGKERASGPKGIAFLALPGLDLSTLKKKNAPIGEWPDASEARLTPFMKVMISKTEHGRSLIKTVESLDLQDLSKASDQQIAAVNDLVWEIKRLVYALISGKASDVLGNLDIGSGAKLSASLVADLTASMPRDVIVSAQQQWLPNLAKEIAGGPVVPIQPITSDREPGGVGTTAAGDPPPADAREAPAALSQKDKGDEAASNKVKRDSPTCLMRVLGQCLLPSAPENKPAAQPEGSDGATDTEKSKTAVGRSKSAAELPPAMQAGLKDVGQSARPQSTTGDAEVAPPKLSGNENLPVAAESNKSKATNQSDDLLFPSADELRAMKTHDKDAGREGLEQPATAPTKSNAAVSAPQTPGAPVISIASDVDPESWAEYGGWYSQDYAIFYRPAGHKDKFVYSWLFLTGPRAPKGDKTPAAAVFNALTNKDAQGSCTKCHSVDDIPGKGRVVNFSPPSVESKRGRFTNFIHEPHFSIVGKQGCLTCHNLEKGRPYLKSYEQSNPQTFVSSFGAVKKDLCQSCHTSSAARQDCLTCHKYHVNDVVTPIMSTKIPIQ